MQKRTFLKSALALGVALSAAPILTACSKAEPEKQAAAQAPAAAPAAAEAPKLKPIKVAVTAGPHADIVTKAAEVAKKQGLTSKWSSSRITSRPIPPSPKSSLTLLSIRRTVPAQFQ